MAYDYNSLADFVKRLESAGELKRISTEVSPILEISEITDRVSKQGGPALLFENPGSREYPLLINAFGSHRRTAMALGVETVDEIAKRIDALLEIKPPSGLVEKLRMLPRLSELGSLTPRVVGAGPCQQLIHKDFSLFDLPILQCWPGDAGRFITLPLVFSHHPVSGKRNCGMYRMQVYDQQTTGMRWQIHKHGAHHFREARDRGASGPGRLEVAVAIGADPAVTFAAIAPLPDDLDEMMFAGFLRGRPVEMVRCQTVELEVPAQAEIVLEGYLELNELRVEGPFGDHTGFYSLEDNYPVFHVTCVTRRKSPLYQTIIVGKPPQEDCYLAHAVERIFLPLLRKQLPEIEDMHLPFEGVFHNLVLVSIRKRYPGHARKIMNALWGTGQAMFSKCIVVLDHGIDLHDYSEVTWRAFNNIDPERDLQFTLGPVDSLDHASRLPNFGSKVGVDATRKWPEEGFTRPWPDEVRMTREVQEKVDRIWESLGLD